MSMPDANFEKSPELPPTNPELVDGRYEIVRTEVPSIGVVDVVELGAAYVRRAELLYQSARFLSKRNHNASRVKEVKAEGNLMTALALANTMQILSPHQDDENGWIDIFQKVADGYAVKQLGPNSLALIQPQTDDEPIDKQG